MVKRRDRCTALMHPDDAAARGLTEASTVLVSSAIGSIEVPLEISNEMRTGVVSIPHGWGHDRPEASWTTANQHPGVNVNTIVDASLVDRLSGNAAVNATMVSVTAAPVAGFRELVETTSR